MTDRYAERMTQVVARLDPALVAAVDDLVTSGAFASRSDAVRSGLELLVDRCRRAAVGARIVEGYRSVPQTEQEVGWADEATARMIADEPW
jgi:Arc/MetJ-type ribon-helix-helix transcriptional regulator